MDEIQQNGAPLFVQAIENIRNMLLVDQFRLIVTIRMQVCESKRAAFRPHRPDWTPVEIELREREMFLYGNERLIGSLRRPNRGDKDIDVGQPIGCAGGAGIGKGMKLARVVRHS